MPHGLMHAVQVNPNDNMGGGGCVCDPQKQTDCQPPYIVFPGNDMDSIASPHVVICAACVHRAAGLLVGEIAAGGEVTPRAGRATHPARSDFQHPAPLADDDGVLDI